ncbi:DUF1214 domain-containing protein [Erythrobacter sp. NE805]|uniref:DUF1214 domain-containing protein n=1 Tax=Erythrobacter sp. NE805 TaxID=3389875 RepID=UPI00396AF088
MMRRAALYIGAVLGGAALGIGSALAMAGLWPPGRAMAFGDVEVRGWRSDFAIGSKAADPYTRARVARHGLLALARTEAVYFTRAADDAGAPLSEDCVYRLSGGPMPAGWWSVTLYDGRSMLPDNTDDALSIDAERAGPGAWAVSIAPQRPSDGTPWISSRGAETFDLTLRLYMPSAGLLADPDAVLVPPRVERIACEGAA